ncbi:MAG: oxygenase MpaB family protein [Myxococcota bacterium]
MRRVHERIGSSALKTDGVRWVWAGMTRAILLHRELFVKQDPKTDPELESQYQEYKRIAYVVGLRERDLPETVQDFHDYFARKANELEISNDSIRLANSILGVLPEVASEFLGKHPDVGDAIRVITSGTLPDRVRSQYNLGLDPELRLPKVTAADVNAACGVIDWHVATKHYELAENARKRLAEFAPLGLDAQRRGAHNAFQ